MAGDGGNVMAIECRAGWRGIPTEIVPVEVGETPDFYDLRPESSSRVARTSRCRSPRPTWGSRPRSLREAADQGVVVFAVCAGLQLLGRRYVPSAGEPMEGIALLDLETHAGDQRFMQHVAVEMSVDGVTGTVVGFENHSGLTELGPGAQPIGRMIAGAGNNGRDGTEGAVRDHVYATYLHGPVLPKNPWLADQLIRVALERRMGVPVELAPLDDTEEQRAHDVAFAKALANRGRRTAVEPARLVRGS